MTEDQRNRLLTLAHDVGMLVAELQTSRATSDDKARIRGTLRHLEEAHESLTMAVNRAEQVPITVD